MKVNTFVSHTLHGLCMAGVSLAVLAPVLAAAPAQLNSTNDSNGSTATPIKHVIVIIGENRSFDHVFATYLPTRGQTVHNLLSEGIIQLDANKNAIPGPNFKKAQQLSASDLGSQDAFLLSPPKQQFPGGVLRRRRPLALPGCRATSHRVRRRIRRLPAAPPPSMLKPPPTTSTRWPAPP